MALVKNHKRHSEEKQDKEKGQADPSLVAFDDIWPGNGTDRFFDAQSLNR